ncbi:MAG: PH domain-containing protein [Candidatus Kaelpia imicola]|nr:PH domain-containing protein [Candidatus Kaelpia imicola]
MKRNGAKSILNILISASFLFTYNTSFARRLKIDSSHYQTLQENLKTLNIDSSNLTAALDSLTDTERENVSRILNNAFEVIKNEDSTNQKTDLTVITQLIISTSSDIRVDKWSIFEEIMTDAIESSMQRATVNVSEFEIPLNERVVYRYPNPRIVLTDKAVYLQTGIIFKKSHRIPYSEIRGIETIVYSDFEFLKIEIYLLTTGKKIRLFKKKNLVVDRNLKNIIKKRTIQFHREKPLATDQEDSSRLIGNFTSGSKSINREEIYFVELKINYASEYRRVNNQDEKFWDFDRATLILHTQTGTFETGAFPNRGSANRFARWLTSKYSYSFRL